MDNRLASFSMIEMFSTHNSIGFASQFLEWLNREQLQVVTIVDEGLNINFASYSVKSILGFNYEQLIDKKITDYIHQDDLEKFSSYLESLDFKKKIIEMRFLHKDGYYIDAKAYSGEIYDDQSDEKFYVICIVDYTEHIKAKEALTNSEKLSTVGQLAASIVHEIRNPLTSIKGFLQLLENSKADIQKEYIHVMMDSIEKIEAITSELLYISKPTTNVIKEEDIVSIVKEVCLLMRSQAIINNIELVFSPKTDFFLIKCDRSQMKQVIINLIKNAIEAMPDGGTIKVTIYKDEYLTVDVIDEGVGVPDKLKSRLSNPFFTTKETGTGLGLMVTQNILNDHNGVLSIHDNAPKGSIFRITFKQ